MRKHISIILTAFTMVSCNDKNQDVNLQQGFKNDTTVKASQIAIKKYRGKWIGRCNNQLYIYISNSLSMENMDKFKF